MPVERKVAEASEALASALEELEQKVQAALEAGIPETRARLRLEDKLRPLRRRLQQVQDAITYLEQAARPELEPLTAVVKSRVDAADEQEAAVKRLIGTERQIADRDRTGVTAWRWVDWVVSTTMRKGRLEVTDGPVMVAALAAHWPQLMDQIAPRQVKQAALNKAWVVLEASGGLAGVRQNPPQITVTITRDQEASSAGQTGPTGPTAV